MTASLALSRLRPYTVVFLFLSLSCTALKMPNLEDGAAHDGGSSSRDQSPIVDEVFSMFKSYLEVKLEEKGKQLESKSKLDKQVTQMKFKGNQKQFEHNAEIDAIFDKLRSANVSSNKEVEDLISDGKELIRKRQKLIRIADKSSDGWKVVDEYVSDELASGSEDEKRLKKAKEAASRKRRQSLQGRRGNEKKFRGPSTSTDQQLFRGEFSLFLYSVSFHFILCLFSSLLGSACDPPIIDCVWFADI